MATVGGQVTTSGDLTIAAQSVNSTDATQAFAAVEGPTGPSGLLSALQAYLGGFPLSTQVNGSTIDPTGSGGSLTLGGAVAVVVGGTPPAASLADGAQVSAGGNLTVNSLAQDNIQTSAVSTAGDATQGSVGGAVVVSLYSNEADAIIGAAVANVSGTVDVAANASVPEPVRHIYALSEPG